MHRYTTSGAAKAGGVNVETIRFCQRRGLMAEPAKLLSRIRRYSEAVGARALFIKAACSPSRPRWRNW